MLADELTAPGAAPHCRGIGVDVEAFARELRQAARFDLDQSVISAAHAVRESPIDSRARALDLTRLPFRACWFEWPGSAGGPWSKPASEDRPAPRRLGALVLVDESCQRGSMDFAWVQDEDWTGGVNICPLRATFDWNGDPAPLDDRRPYRSAAETAASIRRDYGHRSDIKRSSDAELARDNLRFGLIESPYWLPTMRVFGPEGCDRLMQCALRDIEGEPDLLRCMLMVINSRNMTERQYRPAPDRLNKQRVKAGKLPLLDTTVIRVRLSRAMLSRATNRGGDPRSPAQAHVVRGHFKIRKSGVWWWSPHVRGELRPGQPAPSPADYRAEN